jgi:hypothetical protein
MTACRLSWGKISFLPLSMILDFSFCLSLWSCQNMWVSRHLKGEDISSLHHTELMAIEEALDAGLAAVRKKQASTIFYSNKNVYSCLLIRSDPDTHTHTHTHTHIYRRINLSALLFFLMFIFGFPFGRWSTTACWSKMYVDYILFLHIVTDRILLLRFCWPLLIIFASSSFPRIKLVKVLLYV